MDRVPSPLLESRTVTIDVDQTVLEADLCLPEAATGLVLFAHGSGSSRHSPRNRLVAQDLQRAGLATLLLDLLTESEGHEDARTAALRFDVELLASRLEVATEWSRRDARTRDLPLGLFGASTGAAAAFVVAAAQPHRVGAIVSRGGRPDLATSALQRVHSPTLLIVGGDDSEVLMQNRLVLQKIGASERELHVVAGATHLFEEPGAMESVARLALNWFKTRLKAARASGEAVR
jgi:dienelactone hydrolase